MSKQITIIRKNFESLNATSRINKEASNKLLPFFAKKLENDKYIFLNKHYEVIVDFPEQYTNLKEYSKFQEFENVGVLEKSYQFCGTFHGDKFVLPRNKNIIKILEKGLEMFLIDIKNNNLNDEFDYYHIQSQINKKTEKRIKRILLDK